MKVTNIYDEVVKQGIEHDNHASDLYIPVNDATKKLIADYDSKVNVTTFRSNIDRQLWFDIPFAYSPFWEKKQSGK